MFKTLESKWNARTPVYLHPYTKENLVWQLKLSAVALLVIVAVDAYDTHKYKKARLENSEN